eukprot:7333712-Pyramimonas_sp.AAC.1
MLAPLRSRACLGNCIVACPRALFAALPFLFMWEGEVLIPDIDLDAVFDLVIDDPPPGTARALGARGLHDYGIQMYRGLRAQCRCLLLLVRAPQYASHKVSRRALCTRVGRQPQCSLQRCTCFALAQRPDAARGLHELARARGHAV